MEGLLKSYKPKNKDYLNKISIEIQSLKKLTCKILSAVKETDENEVLDGSSHTSGIVVCNDIKMTPTEEMYDTVNKYLMALIQYFDSRGQLQSQFLLPSIIRAPMFCNLPTLCTMLWKRAEKICEKRELCTPNPRTNMSEVSLSDRSCQTEISSLMYCESCSLSTDFIKSLIHLILDAQRQHNVEGTNISKVRERIKNEVFDTSQWGVMREWTAAIRRDIDWLLALTVSVTKKCGRLGHELRATSQEKQRCEKTLQNDLDLMRKQLEAEQAQNKYLNQQIENLNTSLTRRVKEEKTLKRNIQEYQEQVKLLGESLITIRDDCRQMKASQKSMRTFVKSKLLSQSRNISDLKNEIMSVSKSSEDHFTEVLHKKKMEIREIEINSEKKENIIMNLKINISDLQNENKKLNEKLNNLIHQRETQEDELSKIRKKVIEFEEIFKENQAKEKKNDFSVDTKLKISGDPLTDMENQRQLNKKKIKALLRENANLKTTITKLKKTSSEKTPLNSIEILSSDCR